MLVLKAVPVNARSELDRHLQQVFHKQFCVSYYKITFHYVSKLILKKSNRTNLRILTQLMEI